MDQQHMVTTTFQNQLLELRERALAELDGVSTGEELIAWQRSTIGSKGEFTQLMRSLGDVSAEERPEAGRAANAVKLELTESFERKLEAIGAAEVASRLAAESVDVTLPGRSPQIGVIHPIWQMIDEISDIFALMGFQTVFGPEVETGRYHFDMLNIPSDHPARDVWDTLIVESEGEEIVLRAHTSPMQARVMEKSEPPIRVIVPGRAYRYEAQDASHEWMFHQIEGLAIDRTITLADLKGVLQEMARQVFGPERRIRFRCDFFPFVEPGVDFAVDCAVCGGKGCRVCKESGWLEIGGAGMVHRRVLEAVGYDAEEYQGFAFGLGVERIVMMRHGVTDIRAFAGNDLRFLEQFATISA
jgi:phenylalanyl-tRNA synthetase alpha chain